MPNSTKDRHCPNCGETADNEDEVCSECGTELLPPEMPPGKKKCVNCPKILPVKANFCGKCRASQIPERTKRTCCGEDLSDDDEICCMCGEPWSEESGSYKQTQEESSKVERESVGKHAAPEGEGSTETAAAVIDQNEGKSDPPSKDEDAQSPILQSHEAVELPSANTDIPEKPKESLSEQHAVSSVQGPERGEPRNSPSHAVISTGPTLDRADGRQLVQGLTASLCNVANEPVRQDPMTTSDESSDESSFSMVSKHSSTDDNQNEEKTVVAPKKTAIFHEKLLTGEVSPKVNDLQQAFSNCSLHRSDANKNETDGLHAEDHQSVLNSPHCTEHTIAQKPTDSDKAESENAQESCFSGVQKQTESNTKGMDDDETSDYEDANDGVGDQLSQRHENESSFSAAEAPVRTHETYQKMSVEEDQMNPAESKVITEGLDDAVSENDTSTERNRPSVSSVNGKSKPHRPRSYSGNDISSIKVPRNGEGDADFSTLVKSCPDGPKQGDTLVNPQLPGKKRKSEQDISDRNESANTEVGHQPENGKKKKSGVSNKDSDLNITEPLSNQSNDVGYNLRSRTRSQSAAGTDIETRDVFSTQLIVDATKHEDENITTQLEETEKMKELKKDLPEGSYYQKKAADEINYTKKKKKLSVTVTSVVLAVTQEALSDSQYCHTICDCIWCSPLRELLKIQCCCLQLHLIVIIPSPSHSLLPYNRYGVSASPSLCRARTVGYWLSDL